jgi:WD40 repeat protein
LHVLEGHKQLVTGLEFSSDGRSIASVIGGGTVQIRDADSGKRIALFNHDKPVTVATFGAHGDKVVSLSDGTARLWNVSSGKQVRSFSGAIDCVDISSDDQWIAAGASDNAIKVWDLNTGELFATLSGHTGPVRCLALHPDGERLLSGSVDGAVKVWDVLSGRQLFTLQTQKGPLTFLAFDRTGHLLTTGNMLGTPQVWDGRPIDPDSD